MFAFDFFYGFHTVAGDVDLYGGFFKQSCHDAQIHGYVINGQDRCVLSPKMAAGNFACGYVLTIALVEVADDFVLDYFLWDD